MLVFAVALMLILILIAWLVARILKLPQGMTVAVILASFLPNAGNFGLSVNLFAFGDAALAQASLFFIASGIMAYTVGVYIASLGRSGYKEALKGLLKIPTIYAVLLALLFLHFKWELPLPVGRVTSLLAQAAIPSMLVLLGMLLRRARFSGKIVPIALANSLRLIVSPLIAVALAALLGLHGSARQAGVMEASMPTAVMVTVLATEFEVEPEFLTAAVFTSTLLSPLTLTPILRFLS